MEFQVENKAKLALQNALCIIRVHSFCSALGPHPLKSGPHNPFFSRILIKLKAGFPQRAILVRVVGHFANTREVMFLPLDDELSQLFGSTKGRPNNVGEDVCKRPSIFKGHSSTLTSPIYCISKESLDTTGNVMYSRRNRVCSIANDGNSFLRR